MHPAVQPKMYDVGDSRSGVFSEDLSFNHGPKLNEAMNTKIFFFAVLQQTDVFLQIVPTRVVWIYQEDFLLI
jgi:hypothetical protein